MSGFPGLMTSIDGTPYIDPGAMAETLAGLRNAGSEHALILTQEAELPAQAFDLLKASADAQGLSVDFAPIIDYSVPDQAFMKSWSQHSTLIHAGLKAGRTMSFCCQHGAGRSGLVAAFVLIECGMPPKQAITRVRDHFNEAIENDDQENWLLARR